MNQPNVGSLTYYEFPQQSPLHFPFLSEGTRPCVLFQAKNELDALMSSCKPHDFEGVTFYSSQPDLIAIGEFEIKHINDFDPLNCSLLVTFSSIRAENEIILREKSLRTGSLFGIAETFMKSCPATVETTAFFRGIDFKVYESVEIPANFTNWSYVNALRTLISKYHYEDVLEMFAGSGAIGFSLANEIPGLRVDCVDANFHAVRAMRRTQKQHGIKNLNIMLSELFSALRSEEKSYDLIVGNPPHMNMPIEFHRQINGRDPGFEVHHQFFLQATKFLRKNGRIALIENAHSNVLREYYPHLPASLKVTSVRRMPGDFWDLVEVSHTQTSAQ